MATGVRFSVFSKLLAIMLTMALLLLVIVSGFFAFVVSPNVDSSVDRLFQEYAREVAATSPDSATARRLRSRIAVSVRYEGPRGSWATRNGLPTIAQVRQGTQHRWAPGLPQPEYALAPAPDGGTYLFAWNFGSRLLEAHWVLAVLLLAVMFGVIVAAYKVLEHLLGPLRSLSTGVAQLANGQLDVRLPPAPHDEFGRLTDAFNEMVDRVRAMIHARDQLLADVSHELRSPLTRMKVALELLPDHTKRASLAADVAEMERMITELLELERLRTGPGLDTSRHDIVAVIREVAGRFRDRPPGVRVLPVATQRALQVDIDVERFRTVLRNLLENAVKYSLPDSRPVEFSASENEHAVVVRVTDDGVGIAEADAENVFEPFYRVDRSRTKSSGGYGLGLSICKRVMEAHGGTIALEPARGRGATFVLTFPRPPER